MNLTGYKQINFLNQTKDFDYNLSLAVSNTTGYFEFGLSGINSILSFNGQYGKLRDKNGDILIGYDKDRPLEIHGNIYSNKESLSIDGLSIYKNIENTGYNFNYLYLNSFNCELDYTFSLTGETTDFNLSLLNKKIKDFNITGADGTTFSTKTLTGLILNKNPNLEIQIFSGEVLNKNEYYSINGFPISFYTSGQYLINTHTGEDALANDSFEARFYTNFGIVDKTIQISGEVIPLFFLYFNVLPTISGFPNFQNTGYDRIFVNNIKNYYVSYGYVSGAQVQASLTYLKGLTGDVTGFLNATGVFSGYLSGFITGSGFLSTFISGTGINFSGFNDFTNSIQSSEESGFFAQKLFTATGYSQSNYYATGFGLGSGIILKDIYASGIQNFTYSGQIPYIGGLTVLFTPQPTIGTGRDVNEINQPIYPEGLLDYADVENSVKILYTGIITGLLLDTGAYSKKSFSYEPTRTGKFEFESFIAGTGLKSGVSVTGIVTPQFFIDMPFGYFQFIKEITGVVSGESRTQDESKIFTGYQDLLACKSTEGARKYLATAFSNSGIKVTGYAFLSTCYNGQIPSGFLVKFKKEGQQFFLIQEKETVGSLDTNVKNDGCVDYTLQLDNDPKWIVIKPTGVFELLIGSGISGLSKPLYTDTQFFTENTDKQYQTFSNFSGRFENLVNDNCSTGIWEQYFQSYIQLDENYSNFYIKNTNINFISLEDNGRDYPSEVYFNVKNNFENYNFQLSENNTVINRSPERDLYLKLILSKKILDGYSGFYESDYFKVTGIISFCTGLSLGDYRAKVKYINVDNSPKIKPICRIPVQVANILDKNIYNKRNIDLFTGSGLLSQDFYTYRYFGSGWHQQANLYFTETQIYGHDFITGYTQVYRDMLYTPPYIPTNDNFTPSIQLLRAIDFASTQLSWSGSGIKNINIFTNRIALSGISKNQFLNYINNLYISGKFIVNVFDSPDTSLWDKQSIWQINDSGLVYESDNEANLLEVYSTDLNEPFLKDIAEVGGGSYYTSNRITFLESLYNNYSLNIAPKFNQPMYRLCDGIYPRGSSCDGPQPGSSTSAGQTGIDSVSSTPSIPPIVPNPPFPPNVSPPPITPSPPGNNTNPGPEESDGANEDPDPDSSNFGAIIGDGGGGGGGGGGAGTASKSKCPNPNKYDLQYQVYAGGGATPISWISPWIPQRKPTNLRSGNQGVFGPCYCVKPGVARLNVKILNYNCAEQSAYVDAKIVIVGPNGKKSYTLTPVGQGGNTRVTIPKADGKPGEKDLMLEGNACGPVKGEYMQVLFRGKVIGSQNGDESCECECPDKAPPKGLEKKYDLKGCPNGNIVPIFAWNCRAQKEARNVEEQRIVDFKYGSWGKQPGKNTLGPWNPGQNQWLYNCKKCVCKIPDWIRITCSYPGPGPCGFHQCDSARFIIKAKNISTLAEITLGLANLNNGNDGGARQGLSTQLFLNGGNLLTLLEQTPIGSSNPFLGSEDLIRLNTQFKLIIECADPEDCHTSANYYRIEVQGSDTIEGCGTGTITIDLCPDNPSGEIVI